MHKIFSSIIIIIVVFRASFSCSQNQDEDTTRVKGGYTACTVYDYKVTSGKFDTTTRYITSLSLYNTNGNRIEYWYYKPDKSLGHYVFYKYDADGNMTNEIFHLPNDTVYLEYLYYYDEMGRITGQAEKGNYWDKSVKSYEYNEDGDLINKRTYYQGSGLLNTSMVYQLDKNHKRIKAKYFNDYGVHYATFVYKYDDNGNMTEEWLINSDSSYSKQKTFKYDAKGNVISEENDFFNNSPSYKAEYKYNTEGTRIEEIKYLSGGPGCYKQKYKYDADRNTIEIIDFNESNEPVSIKEFLYSK
ncbi:MAG: hypothetical protein V1904_03250 [Bacteroidota bacterium]